MRPLRSFLLLLIFLACFTGLHYLISLNQLFPSIYEFVPAGIINTLISAHEKSEVELSKTVDTISVAAEQAVLKDSLSSTIPEKPAIPLQSFNDSLKLSRGQIRIIY